MSVRTLSRKVIDARVFVVLAVVFVVILMTFLMTFLNMNLGRTEGRYSVGVTEQCIDGLAVATLSFANWSNHEVSLDGGDLFSGQPPVKVFPNSRATLTQTTDQLKWSLKVTDPISGDTLWHPSGKLSGKSPCIEGSS